MLAESHLALINEKYLVPHHVSANFTGREEVCKMMQKNCLNPQITTMQRRFVLHGLGGSGKTQVALKFAQGSRERYSAILLLLFQADKFQILGHFLDRLYHHSNHRAKLHRYWQ